MKNKFEIFNADMLDKLWRASDNMKDIELDGRREIYPNMIRVSEAWDELYFYEKLKLYCSELSYQQMSNANRLAHTIEDFALINDIVDTIEKGDYSQILGIKIFNKLRASLESVRLDKGVNFDEIQDIIALIRHAQRELGDEDSIRAFSIVSNISIRSINNRDKKYSQLFIAANSEILNIHYVKNKKFKLQPGIYKNMITLALNISKKSFFNSINVKKMQSEYDILPQNKYEWAAQFAECYKNQISKKDAKSYYHYCMGYIHYSAKEYLEAHKYLLKLKGVRGMFINLSAKALHLKVLYDAYIYGQETHINSIKNIKKILDSYRKLIEDDKKRKEELNYQIEYHVSFLNNFGKLFNFQQKYDEVSLNTNLKKEKKRIKQQLQQTFFALEYHFKGWLLQKLDEIR